MRRVEDGGHRVCAVPGPRMPMLSCGPGQGK